MDTVSQKKLKGKKVLIATLPAEGHINPLTGIAKYLQEAGCDVRWYTSGIFEKKFSQLNLFLYPFVKAFDANTYIFDDLFPERKLITDPGERANFDMTNGLCRPTPGMLADIQTIYQDFHFDIVLADNLFPAIPLVKAKLNVPVISIGVMPLSDQSADLGPYGLGLYPPENNEQREAYSKMTQHFNNVVFKGLIGAYSAILDEYNIPHENTAVSDTIIKNASLHLQIGTPSFEYQRSDLGSNVRFIGALLPYAKEKRQEKWFDERLNRYKRIVLVTQGTVERDVTKILEPTLEAYKNTDTLVIATTGGTGTAALRQKYPFDNVIIEDFISFNDVMPYASVYVSNGGYGGTLLGVIHHLPMVAAGVHEGKNEICARIGYFKYGVDLKTETPTSKAIQEAVHLVLTDDSYKQNVTRLADELKTYKPMELIADYVLELLNEK